MPCRLQGGRRLLKMSGLARREQETGKTMVFKMLKGFRKAWMAGWIFIVFSLFPLFAFARGADWMDSVSADRLPNGLSVILMENHKAPAVSFQVWYRAGARNDVWGKTGLAHLSEHLMFKGTKHVSREDFARRIEEIGGNYNAFTSHDFAAYFENVAADRVAVPIRLEADRMQYLEFTETEFETEKMVVMEERRLRTQDRPKAFLTEQLEASAFQTQPYHWPVIGWMDDLRRIDYADALRFRRTYYNPANAFIVAVGDFHRGEILKRIAEAFGAIPARERPVRLRFADPPQTGERRLQVHRAAALPYVLIGFHVPNRTDPDAAALEVLAAILSHGRSARLKERIVSGKRLAISAGAHYDALMLDQALFYLSAEALPGKNPAQLETALLQEIEELRQQPVSARELQKAKNRLEAGFVFSRDSLFRQALQLARREIVSSWKDLGNYLPGIRAVSPQDVRRVVEKYFSARNRTVGILQPVDSDGVAARGVLENRSAEKGEGELP